MSASRPGRPFLPKNPGKPKGARDRRTAVGIEVARAMSARAFDRLAALVDSRSHRVAFEASRLILSYAWGLPKATLEVQGGFANLSQELSAALAAARAERERRALEAARPVLEAVVVPDDAPGATEKPQLLGVGATASPGEVVAPEAAVPELNAEGGVTP
jgi:hypothetical protein